MKSDPKSPVTLESLLQLKRSERPPEEFWAQFESELRAKQLAAIVERRPWWSPFERMSLGLVRRSAPVGAAAALAVALLGFHEYRVHVSSSPVPSVPRAQGEAAAPEMESVPVQVAEEAEPPAASRVAAQAEPSDLPAAAPASAKLVVAKAQPARSAPADLNVDPFSGLTEGARQAASLQGPSFARLDTPAALVSPASFTTGRTVAVSSIPVDPLARMTVPSDDRRSIYLNDALPGMAGQSDEATVTTTRVASRLSDERLYEQIRRLGVGGDRLQIRF